VNPAAAWAAPQLEARRLHEAIQSAVVSERRAIRDIARGLAAMKRGKLERELGFADLVEYGEQCFGFGASKTRQLVRLGERLPHLPALEQALVRGELGWTKARSVSQVATPETDGEWVLAALQNTSRDLEELVACSRHGDSPPRPSDEIDPPRYVWANLRFEVPHYELLMRALTRVRKSLGDPDLSLGQLMLIMAERELDRGASQTCAEPVEPVSGDVEEGNLNAWRAQYLIVAHRCPECHVAWMETQAGKVELSRETHSMVEDDADVVNGDDSAGPVGHLGRTIPPATRRAVLARDGCRCQVPGCRHDRFLALHHVHPYSHGGSHAADNLITVCTIHHDLLHRDVLKVCYREDGKLHWSRGSGDPLAAVVSLDGDRSELDHAYLAEFEGPAGSWSLMDDKDIAAARALERSRSPWRKDVSDLRTLSQEEKLAASCAARFPVGRSQIRAGCGARPVPLWMRRPADVS